MRHLLRSAITSTQTGLTIPVVGCPVRVEDLAKHMIGQAQPAAGAVRIVHTGLRLADKLHEQLVSPHESAEALGGDASMLAVRSHVDATELEQTLSEIRLAVAKRDRLWLMRAIHRAVPDYVDQQGAIQESVQIA